MDKIHIASQQLVVASYYHDSAGPIEFDDLEEALPSGDRAGELRTWAQKREFDACPWGGAEGARVEHLALGQHMVLRCRTILVA